jgi:hypothetical protein
MVLPVGRAACGAVLLQAVKAAAKRALICTKRRRVMESVFMMIVIPAFQTAFAIFVFTIPLAAISKAKSCTASKAATTPCQPPLL